MSPLWLSDWFIHKIRRIPLHSIINTAPQSHFTVFILRYFPNIMVLYSFMRSYGYNKATQCYDLLTSENTDSDLKVHALHYANELLVRVRRSFQKNFINLASRAETMFGNG